MKYPSPLMLVCWIVYIRVLKKIFVCTLVQSQGNAQRIRKLAKVSSLISSPLPIIQISSHITINGEMDHLSKSKTLHLEIILTGAVAV